MRLDHRSSESLALDPRLTDAQLASRFWREPELFTEVYDRHYPSIHRYVAGRLDTQAADDIVAETFLVAFGQREAFDPDRGSLRPWLFGIATNLVARHRRSEARRYAALARTGPDLVLHGHESRVADVVDGQRMRRQLVSALAELSRGERDVVLLVALGELSHEEVAQALGISYGTVGSRLSRARKKLNAAITKGSIDG